MEIAASVISSAAKVLEKPLERLGAAASDRFEAEIKKWKNKTNRDFLSKQLLQLSKVKTLWHRDRAVSLSSFYYPLKVIVSDRRINAELLDDLSSTSEYARVVSQFKDLPGGSCVIEGTVGQGKSVFMRHLVLQELKKGDRIPLLIECRNIERGAGLRENMFSLLKSLRFEISDDLFDFYASSGAFVVALDAFDELHESLILSTIKEIEYLINQYPDLQIVITSRLEHDIQNVSRLPVVQLAYLDESDFEPFLTRLTPGSDLPKRICRELQKTPVNVKAVLCTPLMLTLLLVKFIYTESVPNAVSDFYKDLFRTVLSGHDRLKPGYRRKRQCRLSDDLMEHAFDAFCFHTRRNSIAKVPKRAFADVLQAALKPTRITADAEAFKSDLVKVACLMQEEGHDVCFSHKSVQEFHAASFVSRSPDIAAAKFYEWLAKGEWSEWEQELAFLRELDQYRWTKKLHLPLLRETREHLFGEEKLARPLMEGLRFGMTPQRRDAHGFSYLIWPRGFEVANYIGGWFFDSMIDRLETSLQEVPTVGPLSERLAKLGNKVSIPALAIDDEDCREFELSTYLDALNQTRIIDEEVAELQRRLDSLIADGEALVDAEESRIEVPL